MQAFDLRAELERITNSESDTTKHPGLVAALPGHSIICILPSDPRSPSGLDLHQYNCFAYALSLVAPSSKARQALERFPFDLPESDFMEPIIETDFVEKNNSFSGSIVVYFDGMKLTHAGRLARGDRVISKWGRRGQLWEHARLEVPSSYGGPKEFAFDEPKVKQSFLDWLRLKRHRNHRLD